MMYCRQCKITGVLLFPKRVDGEAIMLCADCVNIILPSYVYTHPNETNLENAYIMKWKLRNEFGHEWIETHNEMTLTDFEVVYGNNSNEIIWFTLRRKNEAII